jgi:hypothetical protein
MDDDSRHSVWRLYGWFCGLMFCGSCVGAVAWGAWLRCLVLLFTVNKNPNPAGAQYFSDQVQIERWLPIFFISNALEFFCLSVAKLMVLDRMKQFAVVEADGTARRWFVGGRVVMAAVVVGNMVGLGGSIAVAVYFKTAADLASAAAAAAASNSTVAVSNLTNLWDQQLQLAISTQSIQEFCEVAVLLLIILSFAAAGVSCARLLSAALRDMNDVAGAAGKKVRLQIVGTCAVVFVTFLLRAAFATMNAVASLLQNNSVDCPSNNLCDILCYNVYLFMQYGNP